MKILVLCGGSSPERNISIKCGSRVCRALRENGHNAVLLDVMSGVNPDIFERSAGEYDLEADVERFRAMNEDIFKGLQNDTITEFVGKGLLDAAKKADVVFPVTHGVNGEDGKLQALLELYGIKYTGAGILSSAISMNKTMSILRISPPGSVVAPAAQGRPPDDRNPDGVLKHCFDNYNPNYNALLQRVGDTLEQGRKKL